MRRYETIAIIDPDLAEDDRTPLLTRIKEIITEQQGVVIEEDLWGTRKLAYEIKNKPRGYYARYDYCGLGPLVDELERSFRIDDLVMKYLTIQLDPDADVERIQAEIAAAKAASTPADESSGETDTSATEETAAVAPSSEDETASEEENTETSEEKEPADSEKEE